MDQRAEIATRFYCSMLEADAAIIASLLVADEVDLAQTFTDQPEEKRAERIRNAVDMADDLLKRLAATAPPDRTVQDLEAERLKGSGHDD